MSKVAAQAAKASPAKDKKGVGASGAGTSPSMGAEVSKGEKGSSKTLQASVAVAVLVAFASIYAENPQQQEPPILSHMHATFPDTAQKYPAKTDQVFHTTRSLLNSMSIDGGKGQQASSKDRKLQAETKPGAPVPTARLNTTEDEIPYFRPHVLTDSIIPPVTPPHSEDMIGLFLYQNGFSADPISALVPTAELCKNADTIMSTLSGFADQYGCEGKCRVFLHNGWEVSSCEELQENDKLWLVNPDRQFIWPTFEVGHLVEVRHVGTSNGEPIVVETLSKSPKVFKLNNFFTSAEADKLIENALAISDAANKLKRSTTGQGENIREDTHRTSENAWDLNSAVATKLKRRIFELLGVRPYNSDWADGLQTLRYNLTKAYNSHHDYLEFSPGRRLDSANGGANRFATVVVYLSDVEEGGETVFPEGERLGAPVSDAEARADLARIIQEEGLNITKNSWEERLILQCRTKLAVKPQKAQAVLFYSQQPDGRLDTASLHGGCPVLKGTKWASNLWVWNGSVHGPPGSDDADAPRIPEPKKRQIVAQFTASVPGFSLYWKDTYFGPLVPGKKIRMNTFPRHQFRVFRGEEEEEKGELMETFEIEPLDEAGEEFEQHFVFEGDV